MPSIYQGVFGDTSESHVKSATYIAQQVYAVGTDVPNINEVLNSTSTGVRNLLDINGDGTNVVLDTDRPGPPHQGNSDMQVQFFYMVQMVQLIQTHITLHHNNTVQTILYRTQQEHNQTHFQCQKQVIGKTRRKECHGNITDKPYLHQKDFVRQMGI